MMLWSFSVVAMREINCRKSNLKMRAMVEDGLRLCKHGRSVGSQDRAPWSPGSMVVEWRLRTGGRMLRSVNGFLS